jgi:hypothetical protein
VSTNQPDSELIRKYLNGELDARAMHQLERQAQDDPFLAEALEGYAASATHQQANLADLKARLNTRITKKEKAPVPLWRYLSVAATVLVVAGLGWLWLAPKGEEPKKQQAALLKKIPDIAKGPRLSPAMLPKENRVAPVQNEIKQTNTASQTVDRIALSIKHRPVRVSHRNATAGASLNKPITDSTTKPTVSEMLANRAQSLDITTIAVTQFHKEQKEGKIAGTITDAEGRAIPGARIIVKGTNTKVLSNSKGEFFLPIGADKDSVTVQMMGYDTKKLLVNGTGKLDIKLDEATNALAGVEVTHKMRPPDIHDAQPQLGWKAYKAYLHEKAVMPNGETGKVKLKFLVDTEGHISNIRVIRGRSDTMNQKAIALVVNGPEWYGDSDSKLKEVKLKIKFHKG